MSIVTDDFALTTTAASATTATLAAATCTASAATTCPTCADGYQCLQRAASALTCLEFYCSKIYVAPSAGSNKSNLGGIIGGTIGGVVVLLILAFLYWKYVWRGRRIWISDKDQYLDPLEDDEMLAVDFVPPAVGGGRRLMQLTPSTIGTNALNIIPIAYIPGVTVRPGQNTVALPYGLDRFLVFSDLGTLENASIVDRKMPSRVPSQRGGSAANMTTAIRAQPTMVDVSFLEEDAPRGGAVGPSRLQHQMILEEEEPRSRALAAGETRLYRSRQSKRSSDMSFDDPFITEDMESEYWESDQEAIAAATGKYGEGRRSSRGSERDPFSG